MHKRKKKLSSLLAAVVSFALIFTMIPVSALAGDVHTGGWDFRILSDNTLEITAPLYNMSGLVTMPDRLDTGDGMPLQVTAIGDSAFSLGDNLGVTGIVLPTGLKKIGESAFVGTSISSITIPTGCESIGGTAFNNVGLTSIEFASPSSLQSIGDAAFKGSDLTSVVIPDSVISIGNEAFSDCKHLESVTLPHNSEFTTIQDAAFSGCDALHSIDIPSNVTTLGSNVFKASGLQSITIPAGITSIGTGVFGYTASLGSIAVDSASTTFTCQDGVLYNKAMTELYSCPGGKSGAFIIPDGVTTIKASAFEGCKSLTQVTIPSSVTSIEGDAFNNCSNLSKVYIKSRNVNFSDHNVFGGTKLSTAVGRGIYGIPGSSAQTYANTNFIPFYTAYCVVSHDLGNGLEMPDAVVPMNTTMAAPPEPTFRGCDFGGWYTDSTYTREWDFDSDVVTGDMTLYAKWTLDGSIVSCCGETDNFYWAVVGTELTVTGCSLTITVSLIIPDAIDTGIPVLGTLNVTRIGKAAFNSNFLTIHLKLPSSLKSIGDRAFESFYKLESVSIPATVEAIGQSAFSTCGRLNNVTFDGTSSLRSIGDSAFSNSGLTSITIPNIVTVIGANAFQGCSSLASVTLPDNATFTTIPNNLFDDCESLSTVNFPAHVTAIGDHAFRGTGFTGIVIPDTVESIGECAFQSCAILASVTLPDNATFTTIPDNLFDECESLSTVNFPAHVTAIGDHAFRGTGFTGIVIPDTIESIGEGAFSGCQRLSAFNVNPANTHFSSENGVLYNTDKTTLLAYPAAKSGAFDVPDGVKTIAEQAFGSCKNMTEVSIPQSVTRIDKEAFISCEGLAKVSIKSNDAVFGDDVFSGTKINSDGIYGIKDSTAHNYARSTGTPFHIAFCTVKFDSKSGSNVPGLVVDINQKITKPAAPTRTGYQFGGWFKDTDCTQAFDFGSDTVSENTTLYAKWIDTFTVTFDSQGASVNASPSTKSALYGQTLDALPAEPQKPGYTFGGWWTQPNGGGTQFTASSPVTGNTTVYAKWILIIPVAISCSVTDAPLYGANGNITITASGGNSGTYLYSVDGGVHWSSVNSFNVAAGTYTAAVCDASNNGNAKIQTVVVGQPSYIGAVPAKKLASKQNAGTALTIKPPTAPRGYAVVSITYSSSNPSVAAVDANGNVTFLAGGKATIITKLTSQKTDSKGRVKTKTTTIKKMITVQQPVASLTLNMSSATIARKDRVKLTASIAPVTASNKKVTWKSSNPKVASVSSAGVVTGKAGGTAIITCTAKYGSGAAASCTVTVTPIYPTGLKISKTALTVKLGKTASLKATIAPKTTDFKTVTWTSSNPSVAAVDAKGKVKGIASGTAIVTATTSNGLSTSCTIIVQ